MVFTPPFGSPRKGQKAQKRGRKPPSGAQNRYVLRLAGHQSPRQIVWDENVGGRGVYNLQLIFYS